MDIEWIVMYKTMLGLFSLGKELTFDKIKVSVEKKKVIQKAALSKSVLKISLKTETIAGNIGKKAQLLWYKFPFRCPLNSSLFFIIG